MFLCTRAMIVFMLCLLLCTACATPPGPKATIGGLGGAAGGGLLAAGLSGGDPAITAGGVILGLLIGGAAGDRLDAADRRYMQQASYRALEYTPHHRVVAWRNPRSQNHGTVQPTRTYQGQNGQTCREYRTTVAIGSEHREAYGVACRDAAGEWRIVNQ